MKLQSDRLHFVAPKQLGRTKNCFVFGTFNIDFETIDAINSLLSSRTFASVFTTTNVVGTL
jgi:hypothetical protein